MFDLILPAGDEEITTAVDVALSSFRTGDWGRVLAPTVADAGGGQLNEAALADLVAPVRGGSPATAAMTNSVQRVRHAPQRLPTAIAPAIDVAEDGDDLLLINEAVGPARGDVQRRAAIGPVNADITRSTDEADECNGGLDSLHEGMVLPRDTELDQRVTKGEVLQVAGHNRSVGDSPGEVPHIIGAAASGPCEDSRSAARRPSESEATSSSRTYTAATTYWESTQIPR